MASPTALLIALTKRGFSNFLMNIQNSVIRKTLSPVIDCFNGCPCFDQCPQGCLNCPNPICGCADPENNEDYKACEAYYHIIYRKGWPLFYRKTLSHLYEKPNSPFQSKCVVLCEVGDNACFQSCAREYAENLKSCPCQEKCPTGCPCPDYQCPATTTGPSTTTTTLATTTSTTATTQTTTTSTTVITTTADLKTWILVLNTWSSSNKPLIIDGQGHSKEIGFVYNSYTEAYGSCSVIWRGNMFIFGGLSHKRQISMVDQCQLKRVGDLPFDMVFGACAQRNDQQVYICFEVFNDSSTGKNCHVSSGPLENFSSLPSSSYERRNTRIAVTNGKNQMIS